MKKLGVVAIAALLSLSFATPSHAGDAGDVGKGEKYVEKKCTGCHDFGDVFKKHGKIGPSLEGGVVGKTVGQQEGFKYSSGMQKAAEEGVVWDEETLDKFLTKPKDVIERTKMSFAGIKKESDRANVIAFLKTL